MPSNCAVYGCFNTVKKTANSNVRYFRFPKDESLRRQWVNCCRRADNIKTKYALVCSIHFTEDDYADDIKYRLLGTEKPRNQRALKKDAVPSLFLPNGKFDSQQLTEENAFHDYSDDSRCSS